MVTNWEGKLCLCNKFNVDGGLAGWLAGDGAVAAYVQKLVIVFVCTMSLCIYVYVCIQSGYIQQNSYDTAPDCARDTRTHVHVCIQRENEMSKFSSCLVVIENPQNVYKSFSISCAHSTHVCNAEFSVLSIRKQRVYIHIGIYVYRTRERFTLYYTNIQSTAHTQWKREIYENIFCIYIYEYLLLFFF